MKKLIYNAAALALAFFAVSCQQENLEPVAGGNTVTYTVQVSDAATKAIGDDITAVNELVYAVYRTEALSADDHEKAELKLFQKTAEINNGTATVTFELVNNQNFRVLFWAQVNQPEGEDIYDTQNLKNVTLKQSLSANAEDYAAFAGSDYIKSGDNISGRTITLVRPVSQLNIATTLASLVIEGQTTVEIDNTAVTVNGLSNTYNVATGLAEGESSEFVYEATDPADLSEQTLNVNGTPYSYISMNYVGFAGASDNASVTYYINTDNVGTIFNTIDNVPFKANYRTNIIGNLITSTSDYIITLDKTWDAEYIVEGGNINTNTFVSDADEFVEAFTAAFEGEKDNNMITLAGDINLNDLLTRAVADPSYTIPHGKTITIDLNGNKLSATSSNTGANYNMFDVRGTLNVKNGTIEYEHKGENMGWNKSTNIFHVEGGVLNLEGVTAKNLGGSDMGFVAHLNNWSDYELSLNVENSTLESNYVAVRVFNSGPRMNNVDIKNSTLKGGSYAFWVHNYTVADFGTEAKAEAQKALLNLKIYDQDNTFSPDVNGIRYGFTNSVKTDANGVTKVVSEDGTEVTLGAVVENAVIRRGVAGTEENTTITKVVVEEGVAVLYDRTFRRFYALETVELPSTLTTIGAAGSGVFQSCTNLKNIVLPESVTVLGKGSFQECSSLESINIPAGVTRIESDALRATGLKSVEFHAGVTYFGAQAFRDCKQLTEVIINAPEFTMEGNTFGIMAAPFTPMTIYVANAAMKAYVESNLTAHAKTYITVVAPEVVDNAAALAAACAEGKNVILNANLTDAPVQTKAPYGNYYGVKMVGGVLDGNGNTLDFEEGPRINGKADNYGIMISAGTIKNLKLSGVFRSVVIMDPTDDITIDNVVFDPEDEWGNCYPINTAEGDGTHNLYVNNCVIAGWNSYGSAIKNLYFKNTKFVQGSYYTNVYGRLSKPYVTTVYENCDFCNKYYIDLSSLGKDNDGNIVAPETKITLKNCSVNGVKLTAENWTSLVASEDSCGEGQISIELRDGSYLTAENIADYVIFE